MPKKALMVWIMTLVLVLTAPAVIPAASEDIYLETIGGLGGSQMYITYAYIGVTADAYSKEIYPAGQVKAMMGQTKDMLRKVLPLLRSVQQTGLEESDREFLNSMIEVYGLLETEAEALSAFVSSHEKKDLERYDQARKEAWPKIKKLLGLE